MGYLSWIILALISAALSALIAKKKGRNAAGWFLAGLFFSIFSVSAAMMAETKIERRRTRENEP